MSETGWDAWQVCAIDDYILGYSQFENQKDLANHIGKNINSLKIRLSRRRKELSTELKREITQDEYLYILSNRFSKNTMQIANEIKMSNDLLLEMMDDMDSLECKESLSEGFENRQMTNDEYEIFVKLFIVKKLNNIQISHILNRNINFISELIKVYETA